MTEGLHYSKELESAILGACLLEKTAIGRTYGIVDACCFYHEDNQKVFATLVDMFDKNLPIDLITVWHMMVKNNISLYAGDVAYYLMRLTNHVVSTAHLEYHCTLIKEMWRKRELEKITHAGIDPHRDTKEQIAEMHRKVQEIQGSDFRKDWFSMEDLMYDLVVHQQNIREGKLNFITTGFKSIDRLNGGFYAGQMIVVGARPSMGKSALIGKMAIDMAKNGKKVGIISLEMDNNQIAARLAAVETDINFQTIYRNLFEDEKEQNKFHSVISNQSTKLPIYVSDKTKVDVNEIKAKVMKMKNRVGCDCVIIDYLQLVDSQQNKNYNREQEVAKISRGFKLMAIEMEIPVIVLCQLNREGQKRAAKDRYPRESDLRESGAIEQDADAILLLHRDWKAGYETDPATGESTEFEADLLGVKWRNGATFHLKLDFDPPKMKFSEQQTFKKWNPVPYSEPVQKDDNPF